MGKKYIIELEDASYVNGSSYKDDILYRVKGFKSLVFDKEGLEKLEPYEGKESLRVGDEVIDNLGKKYIIYKVNPSRNTAGGISFSIAENTFPLNDAKYRTGKVYPEMIELMQKWNTNNEN